MRGRQVTTTSPPHDGDPRSGRGGRRAALCPVRAAAEWTLAVTRTSELRLGNGGRSRIQPVNVPRAGRSCAVGTRVRLPAPDHQGKDSIPSGPGQQWASPGANQPMNRRWQGLVGLPHTIKAFKWYIEVSIIYGASWLSEHRPNGALRDKH